MKKRTYNAHQGKRLRACKPTMLQGERKPAFEIFIIAAHGTEIVAEVDTLADVAAEVQRVLALDGALGVTIRRMK